MYHTKVYRIQALCIIHTKIYNILEQNESKNVMVPIQKVTEKKS